MVGGFATWTLHVRDGFRALGHEADVVTCTRSGKPRASWSSHKITNFKWRAEPYEVVTKYTNAVDTLNGYDGIILVDPCVYRQDREALRGLSALVPDVPDYVTILERVSRPVTVAIHCSRYERAKLPFLDRLLSVPTFNGKVVTHSRDTFEEHQELWPDLTMAHALPLPYRARHAVDGEISSTDGNVVGITGRYSSIKGHHVLAHAWAAGYLPSADAVVLYGGGDTFRGPSASRITYERLLSSYPDLVGKIADGSPSFSLPWTITNGHSGLGYVGNYYDGYAAAESMDVHLNLTTRVASGALEYAQLEAIDAGAAQLSLAHRWDQDYLGVVLPSVAKWPGDVKLSAGKSADVLQAIGDGVCDLLDLDPSARAERRHHNRKILALKHDPKLAAQAYLDVLFTQ